MLASFLLSTVSPTIQAMSGKNGSRRLSLYTVISTVMLQLHAQVLSKVLSSSLVQTRADLSVEWVGEKEEF